MGVYKYSPTKTRKTQHLLSSAIVDQTLFLLPPSLSFQTGTKVVLRPSNSRRRRQPSPSPPTNNQLVMGQVRILKRGEVLKDLNNNFSKKSSNTATVVKKKSVSFSKENVFELCSTGRLGPNPEDITVYAGSGFFTSPPPCKVPLPGFLEKIGDVACSGLGSTICLYDDLI